MKLVGAFIQGDNPRNREIHFTDLINCLFCSFMRKIIPEAITEEKYNDLLDWMRGLAFDTTITNRFAGKARLVIGKAMGHVDMMFPSDWLGYTLPYELTSTPFLPKDIDAKVVSGDRYRYKVEQLKLYMAASCLGHGRLKIIQMVNVRKKQENNGGLGASPIATSEGSNKLVRSRERPMSEHARPSETHPAPPQFKSKLQTREHTYDVFMTPLELAGMRRQIVDRQACLDRALTTGGWWRIPRVYRPILPDSPCANGEGVCSSYADAVKEPELVHRAWRNWTRGGVS